jgi:hypothetical protein
MYYAAPPAAVMQWWQHLPIPAAILNPLSSIQNHIEKYHLHQ